MRKIVISLDKFSQAKYLNDCILNGKNKGETEFNVLIKDSQTYSNVCAPIAGIVDFYKDQGIKIKISTPRNSYASHVRIYAPIEIESSQDSLFVAPFDKVWTFSSENAVYKIVAAFVKSLREGAEIEKGISQGIEWCMSEVLDNVLQHSEAGKGFAMAQMHKQNKTFSFCAFDTGVGIYNSLSKSKHNPKAPFQAIELAMQERITRDEKIGQGNGLWGFSQIIKETNGRFIISSGGAKYSYLNGAESRVGSGDFNLGKEFGTTMIDFQMDYSVPIDILKALNGYEPLDLWNENHETDAGTILIDVEKESNGTGTRKSAEKMRNIVLNFLKEGYSSVTLDFKKVDLVSSSYADELIGKLVALLGFSKFMQYIVVSNVNEFNEAVINRSVGQRMAQSFMDISFDETD